MKLKTKPPASSKTALPTNYYPVFLNMNGGKAVVIGGGKVAERKILALLRNSADVTVISPQITTKIEQEKHKGRVKHIKRQYRKGDLKQAFLVIAATDSLVINRQVSKDAPCLVNVVDTPDLCNFIVPSTVKRGPLSIAVSTGGISPALSRSVRRELERMYGPAFSEYLKSLKTIRAEAKNRITDQRERSEFLKSVASEKMIRILREKGYKEAKRNAKDLLKKAKNTSC